MTSTPVSFSKRANVAAFAADDPAFHIVVGNVDRAGRVIRRMTGRKTLGRHHQDFAGFVFADLLHLFLVVENSTADFVFEFVFEQFQQPFGRLFFAQAGHLVQLFSLLVKNLVEVFFGLADLFQFDFQSILGRLNKLFLFLEVIGLLLQTALRVCRELVLAGGFLRGICSVCVRLRLPVSAPFL